MMLAIASWLHGDDPDVDPPPRPPQWGSESQSVPFDPAVGIQADFEGQLSSDAVRHAVATSGDGSSDIAYERSEHVENAGVPLEVAPAIVEPGQSSVWLEGEGAAPMSDLWLVPKLFRPDIYPRHQGEGEPLVGTSWLNRPYYTGFFLGALHGDTLIPGEINQSIGFFGGFRLGWDYDIYWGLETRLGFSNVGLDFIDEPSVDGLATDVVVWDASLVYYPWGDSRWRPYLTAGIGLVDYDFLDAVGLRHSDAVVGVPWGIGLKYRHSDWIALRFDFLDNVAFGGRAGFETMNNLSLTGGLEFRFGGTRKSYFPWNPSRTIR